MPSGGPGYLARLVTAPIWLVIPVRPGQPAVAVGRVPSGLAVGGMPAVLLVGRVPAGLGVHAVKLGSTMLPVGPACAVSRASIVGLAGRHVFPGRPGDGLLRGKRRIEPGHKVTPSRVLVALPALGVIPVRHVPPLRIEACPPR